MVAGYYRRRCPSVNRPLNLVHNFPLARFLARLRKITWMLPLAVAAGAATLMRADVRTAATQHLPSGIALNVILNSEISFLGMVLLTILCSARVAVRIAKAKKFTQISAILSAFILGVILFFGYSFAEWWIVKVVGML
jgi:hypothetical protein